MKLRKELLKLLATKNLVVLSENRPPHFLCDENLVNMIASFYEKLLKKKKK